MQASMSATESGFKTKRNGSSARRGTPPAKQGLTKWPKVCEKCVPMIRMRVAARTYPPPILHLGVRCHFQAKPNKYICIYVSGGEK